MSNFILSVKLTLSILIRIKFIYHRHTQIFDDSIHTILRFIGKKNKKK